MAVDPNWLAGVRHKNQAALGMAGLGYTFVSSGGIVGKNREERELRRESIHAGRFEERDPNKPTEGSIESIAAAIGPAGVPAPQQIPKGLTYLLGAAVVGLGGYVVYKLATRSGR